MKFCTHLDEVSISILYLSNVKLQMYTQGGGIQMDFTMGEGNL